MRDVAIGQESQVIAPLQDAHQPSSGMGLGHLVDVAGQGLVVVGLQAEAADRVPGVGVEAARGGTFDGVHPMNGTSMAAPHVTGAIALLLSRMAKSGQPIPTATQATAALRQVAMNSTGNFTNSQGYGLIDVTALLNAF